MSGAGRAGRFEGVVAVVVGGASGIGLACAKALSAEGARLVIADRNGYAAEAAAEGMAGAVAAELDVADAAAVEAFFAAHPDVEVMVNSTGTARRHAALEHPLEDWDDVVAVNMSGAFYCARAAARQMLAAGCRGSIVSIASIMGLSGGGLYPNISYQTTKGAVVNMTRALAIEWAPYGIRVNAVAPTYVKTPFIAPLLADPEIVERILAMTPLRDFAMPEDVAEAVLYLSSPQARMVTGHTLPVDGGFLAQ